MNKMPFPVLVAFGLVTAQPYNVSLSRVSNYNSWGTGWDSVYVMSNNLATVAIVPVIGGRIMQCNLGSHAFLYLNDAMKGTTSNLGGQMWGGMRQLASPQSDFTGNWPPPPTLDSRAYTATITRNSIDSSTVYLVSQIEASGGANFNGLQFKRTVTLYKNSSHIRIKMTMVNANGAAQRNHGVWDITEVTGGTSGITYDTMIWVYVPLNPASTMGAGRGYAQLQQRDTTQWVKNAAPGVLGIQYRHVEAKMGADSKAGWVCTVDRRGGYAYAKRFSYVNGGNYPDSGSSVEVYTYGSSYSCVEVEVMGPMVTLANGDSVSLTEDWYAARSLGPVYSVNDAGLITKPLAAQQTKDTVRVQGTYGVFYPGMVKSVFRNASGTIVAVADSHAVTPLDSFVYRDTLKVPAGAVRLLLASYTIDGAFAGYLDSTAVTPTAAGRSVYPRGRTGGPLFSIVQKGSSLLIAIDCQEKVFVDVCLLNGRRLASFAGTRAQIFSLKTGAAPSVSPFMNAGCCIIKARAGAETQVRVVPLLE
jgi:hypothetical protein